jgi:hypothetical protein
MRILLAAAFAAIPLLCAPTTAQSCSDLTVTGTGKPGTSLVFALSGGAPNAFALLAIAQTTGSTTINFGPIGSLTLGLAAPAALLPMGATDASGAVSLTISIPNAPIPSIALHAQGTTATMKVGGGPPSLEFCTSDVEAFQIGGN